MPEQLATQAELIGGVVTTIITVLTIVWGFYRKIKGDIAADNIVLSQQVIALSAQLTTTRTEAEKRDRAHYDERRELVEQVNTLRDHDQTRQDEIEALQRRIDVLTRLNVEKDKRSRANEAELKALKAYVGQLETHIQALRALLKDAPIELPPMPEPPGAKKRGGGQRRTLRGQG